MDQIDINLLESWVRMGEACRADPRRALVRMRRRFKKTVFRPPRAWCWCVRASDTRINEMTAIIEPRHADREHREHDVILQGATIRRLTRPVMIEWPGVPTWRAADMLGISHNMAWDWMKKGYLKLEGKYRGCVPGKPWITCPIVWTPGPLDPNHPAGRPPEGVWGTLWRHFWEKMPESFCQRVRRVPRFRPRLGERHFMGWDWVCGGLGGGEVGGEEGFTTESTGIRGGTEEEKRSEVRSRRSEFTTEHTESTEKEIERGDGREALTDQSNSARSVCSVNSVVNHSGGCGRVCKYLFGPLPIWTLAKATGYPIALEMPAGSGLAGAWEPGMDGVAAGEGDRTFACKHCWGVSSVSLIDYRGWNDFVTQMSGGLLYGHDVKRPLELAPMKRKRRPPRRPRETKAGHGIFLAKKVQRA